METGKDAKFIPKIQSLWRHKGNKNLYRVIQIANESSERCEYPITVIYQGLLNGKIWCKTLANFNEKMYHIYSPKIEKIYEQQKDIILHKFVDIFEMEREYDGTLYQSFEGAYINPSQVFEFAKYCNDVFLQNVFREHYEESKKKQVVVQDE